MELRVKFVLKAVLQKITEKENALKTIITDILSEDDNRQAQAIKTLSDICSATDAQSMPNAIFLMGFAHYYGISIKKDSKRAFTIFEAIKNVSAFAQERLGVIYSEGDGVDKDDKKAFAFFKLAADQGYAPAQCNLGLMYEDGAGVEKDEKKACELYKLAADQGDATAQFILGLMYTDGLGVDKDEKKACELYKLAADQGDAAAQCYLGIMYANGRGVDKDEKKACELYKLAADQGDAAAQFNLGILYANGRGVEKDEKKACELYKLAADRNAAAQCYLGIMYENGRGVNKDEEKAFEYFKLAADQGYALAQCNLGVMYENGRGVEKDEKKACELYKLAADQGNAAAQCNLGILYGDGRGVNKDEKKACELYKLAVEQRYALAQCNLGVMYENGQGVDKDDKKACELYKLAADQGHAKAQYNLGCMYANGRGVDKDEKKAFEYYKLAADQGDSDAQYNLGEMYRDGKGVSKDTKTALEYFQKDCEMVDALEAIQCLYAESDDIIPGMGRDRTKAVLLGLSILQQKGNADLQEQLVTLYAGNASYPRDLKSALDAYNSEAQSDISNLLEKEHEVALQKKRTAFDRLGFCHQFGIGSPKDLKLASECYQEAIELGSTISYHQLYFCYHQGLKSVFTLEELIDSFQNYAKKNNMEAIIILARIYEHGLENLPSDQSLAFFYYQKAHGMVRECPYEEGRKESIAQKIKALTPLNDPTETIASVFFSFDRPLPKPVSDLIAQYAFEVTKAGNSNSGRPLFRRKLKIHKLKS